MNIGHRNSRAVALAVLIASTLAGCASGLTEQQRMWLSQGERCYERDAYGQAIDALDRFLNEVREGPQHARAVYVRGLCHAQQGRRDRAYDDMRRCTQSAEEPDVVWRAYVVLGTLHFEDRQWELGAQHLRAAADRMPPANPKDVVLYRAGLCHERNGDWTAAQSAFADVARQFPDGPFADAARRRLDIRAEHFAVQVGAFRTQDYALTQRDQLRGQGLNAYLRSEQRGRLPMYVVLVGRFISYDDALSYLAMIKEKFAADALLWP